MLIANRIDATHAILAPFFDPEMPVTTKPFSFLPLPDAMLSNLESLNYQTMTPIQEQALPLALQGQDLIAQAKTGSGKTAAFGIPLLLSLNHTNRRNRRGQAQALVLCPTRELSTQVASELRRLARHMENIKVVTLCGGVSIGPQIGSLEFGAHIVVGTPGRIKDHLRKRTLDLSHAENLVLDEADRMLDMGFMEDMESIIGEMPKKRQTLLFSATYPDNIRALSSRFQQTPQFIKIESKPEQTRIQQSFYLTHKSSRMEDLIRVLQHIQVSRAIVFCNTRQMTADVAEFLDQRRFNALALHGDLEQRERDEVLIRFKHQSCSILVATDVAARGLDIEALPAVINMELPRDAEVYTHRIGRTGRAGMSGLSVSLLEEKEQYKLERIFEEHNLPANLDQADTLKANTGFCMLPACQTLKIAGGRKDKVRPGDILGALTGDAGIPGTAVGKIDISDFSAYVSLDREHADKALGRLINGKIKGRKFKVRKL